MFFKFNFLEEYKYKTKYHKNMNKLILISLYSFIATATVNAHSWVYCTDYKILTEDNKLNYDENNCDGYTRCGDDSYLDTQKNGFGADSDFQFTRIADTCQCSNSNKDVKNVFAWCSFLNS